MWSTSGVAMARPVTEPSGEVRLLLCRFTPALARAEQYRPLLDAREQSHLTGLRRESARQRYLVGRALLRHGLADFLGREPQALSFVSGSQGKPGLVGGECCFNLSHSHDWLALAVSRSGPVGVDVEFHGRRNRLEDLARHYFSPEEQAGLAGLSGPARRARFFMLWTLREAYAKALGGSLWDTLSGTRVGWSESGKPQLHLSGRARQGYSVRWWHLELAPDYSLALAGLGQGHHKAALQPFEMIPGEAACPLDLARLRPVGGWCGD